MSGKLSVPVPPWPKGDERGMANTLGPGTWMRCAEFLSAPGAKCYELSHEISNTMPSSPFSTPLTLQPRPTRGMRNAVHASNMETMTGDQGAQGTHMDALGHFGVVDRPWDGTGDFPVSDVRYYGGFRQDEVKPAPDAMLSRLGIHNVPPIVTTAVLLDACALLGNGRALPAGTVITAADIEAMLMRQDLADRGILPGDVVYIHTGWGKNWTDPEQQPFYYTEGPGLGYDAAQWIAERAVVLVALDNPFTDAVNSGQLKGAAGPASGYPKGFPFAVHHHCLVEAGIHQIQNAKLDEIARDQVWVSATIILPLRVRGGCGSLVRPIAIGVPAA
ncbi:MAG: cyclase family protein [Pseudorhodoplanes sp.]|uniref:cyclase family protein n=1 Tax=Pseudorhodoplanes sp. TaxID=1934341 RepID=UPI003D134D65